MSKRKMKDSGVEWLGEIPAEWDLVPARNLFSEVKDKNIDGKVTRQFSFRYGKIVDKDKSGRSDVTTDETITAYRIVTPDTIMINGLNLNYDFISQRVAIVEERGIITSAYLALCPNKKLIEPAFAVYLFKGYDSKQVFHGHGSGIRKTLNYSDFKEIKTVCPDLSTQRKIAEYLDARCAKIDEMVSDAKKTIEEYKAWKASVIFEAVTGKNTGAKMKDSGVDWIGMVPSGWEIVPLRRLGSCVNGISKGGEFFGSGYPFVSYSDVYKNDWLPASVKGLVESTPEERKHYSVREGDVFFTRTSETVDELGMAGACLKTIPDAVFAGFLIRFRPDTTELAVEYSKYYFRNVSLRNFFTKETMLVTRASLSQDLLRSMMVVVPPRSEQIAIARFLDKKCAAIDRVISEKESLIADLESYKKSLIFECVTGKMEVA